MNNVENNNSKSTVVESSNSGIRDWRELYFNKSLCEGVVVNQGNGNVRVVGRVKIPNLNVKIMYWAANPADFNTSFSGSGYHLLILNKHLIIPKMLVLLTLLVVNLNFQ